MICSRISSVFRNAGRVFLLWLRRFERRDAPAVDTLADDPLKTTIVNCVPIFYRTDRFTLAGGRARVTHVRYTIKKWVLF